MTTVLIGGGWSDPATVYGPFLAAAAPDSVVACVVVDEGDGPEQFERWSTALTAVAPCRPKPALVAVDAVLDTELLAEADALLVCGGLTPAYGAALAPVAGEIRSWLAGGRPYAGFSAGAAVAAGRAVVGGYRLGSRVVCPEDAGEDLEQVTVVDGLGLVDFAVDVHAAQWGTLGRLVAAVAQGLVPRGVAIDEDTAVVCEAGSYTVAGAGAVHVVRAAAAGACVTSRTVGTSLDDLLRERPSSVRGVPRASPRGPMRSAESDPGAAADTPELSDPFGLMDL